MVFFFYQQTTEKAHVFFLTQENEIELTLTREFVRVYASPGLLSVKVSVILCTGGSNTQCFLLDHLNDYIRGGTRYILGWGGAARPLIP